MMEFVRAWPSHQVHLERTELRFLLDALDHYRELAGEGGSNPALAFDRAKAYHFIGYIEHKLGHLAEAKESFAQAIVLLEQVTSQDRASRDSFRELAATRNDWADLLRNTDHYAEAEKGY